MMSLLPLFFALAILLIDAGAATIEVTNSYHKGFVKVGDRFSIYCKVTDIVSNTHSVRWERITGANIQEISRDITVASLFNQTGRYSVSLNYDPTAKRMVYTLVIKPSRVEDSSTLRCRRNDQSDQTVLYVYATPFITINGFLPGQKVQYVARDYQNKGAKFTCRVTGGHPRPAVVVKLGNDVVTSAFKISTVERSVGTNGILGTLYDVTAENNKFPIRPDMDQLSLTVYSTTYPYRSISKNITLEVLSAPSIYCGGHSTHMAFLGTKNYNMTCYIHGHPTPDLVTWSWDDETLQPGMSSSDDISVSRRNLATAVETSVHFAVVKKADFDRRYTVSVKNSYGTTVDVVRLYEDTKKTSESSSIRLALISLVTSLALQLV